MSSSTQGKPAADEYAHGIAHYRQGRYRQAIDELASLIDHGDLCGRIARYYHAMSHRQLGVQALREDQFDVAERHLKQAVQGVGADGELAQYLGVLYAKTHRLEQCAAQAERACSIDPSAAAAVRQAQAQWMDGRRAEACMTLTQALRNSPDDPQLHLQLGICCAAEGRYDQAADHLTLAVEADCDNHRARYYLGLVACARGDVMGAMRAFQRAYQLRPSDVMLAYQLALTAKAAVQAGHRPVLQLPDMTSPSAESAAPGHLAQFILSESDFVEAFLALPESQADEELFGLLAGAIQAALVKHGHYADLQLRCSQVLGRLGRTAQAIDHAKKAVEINPKFVAAMVYMGQLYSRSGQQAQAAEILEQAIACGADWPDVHCQAADALVQSGRRVEGRGHLERALELNRSYQPAVEAIRGLAA